MLPAYTLIFGYPVGPSVSVRVTGLCTPGVDNGNLQANADSAITTAISHLLG